MPDDIWDVLEHPVQYAMFAIVLFFVVAIVLGLAWTMLRIAFARATGKGPTLGQVKFAWGKRSTAAEMAELVDLPEIQKLISKATLGTTTSGESKETRIANLEKLHAEGGISADKLAKLKAAIAAEN